MHTLIVIAHPRSSSLTAQVAAQARKRLETDGATVEVLDLHAEGFDPRMTPEDEPASNSTAPFSPAPRSSSSNASTKPPCPHSSTVPRASPATGCPWPTTLAAPWSPWPTATAATSSTSPNSSRHSRTPAPPLDTAALAHHIQQRAPLYDKAQEGHYNLISALHKSMRGSDPDAALYWLARMFDGGEDPLFVARRLTRFANEDIGIAEPHAVQQALAAWDVYERLGSPEGELAIAQAVVYLATAPKSIAVCRGFNAAHRAARRTGSLMPPAHILNAPTRLMKNLGYGKDYQYDPDTTDGFSGADYFPDDMDHETYYKPTRNGYESQISERLRHWTGLCARRRSG